MVVAVDEEWRYPGFPREQLKLTVASPLLVVRFREASPPDAQNIINSLTDAAKNWELVLTNILNLNLNLTG